MWGCNEKVSGGTGMTNAISVKDRLKKQAIEDGKTMQDSWSHMVWREQYIDYLFQNMRRSLH